MVNLANTITAGLNGLLVKTFSQKAILVFGNILCCSCHWAIVIFYKLEWYGGIVICLVIFVLGF